MGNETGQVGADVDSEGPVAGSWPQGALRFGAWLFGLGFVSVVACFVVVDADILFFVAGGLAIATIAVGLVTAINGRGWDRDATTQAQRSAATVARSGAGCCSCSEGFPSASARLPRS